MWFTAIKRRYIYYLKSTGTCIIFAGGCWIFYQLRQISQTLGSAVATDVLKLEQSQAQYIYIDDSYLTGLANVKVENNTILQYSVKSYDQSFPNKFINWWKSIDHGMAYKLLNVAQVGDKYESTKAIFSLGSMKTLQGWDYQHIAQMLDAKTAIALSRIPNVDLRFFLKPPCYHRNHSIEDLIEKVHALLSQLNVCCKKQHLCLSSFLNTNFKDPHPYGWVFDHDLINVGLAVSPKIIRNQEFLQKCIYALYHHSSIEKHSKDIVDAGGLLVLMSVQKMFTENVNICILLAKILSNIALYEKCLEDIFQSGWIRILTAWSQHQDTRLSVIAGKALANLDMTNDENNKFSQHIYLLHPLHRTQVPQKLDVVFIHGLLGGIFVTWRQRDLNPATSKLMSVGDSELEPDILAAIIDEYTQDFLKDLTLDFKKREWKKLGNDYEVILYDCPESSNYKASGPFSCKGDDPCMQQEEYDRKYRTQCWPKDWLPKDVPYIRVVGIDYNTNLSMWTPLCPIENMKSTIKERSDELTWKLVKAGVGKRPIVWVCHSMGGLLAKKMLVEEWKNNDRNNLCRNTRGIIFYSTPHRGSHVAALAPATKMLLWPSTEVQELREESPELLSLNKSFLTLLEHYNIDIVSFSETKPTLISAMKFPFQFVTPESADIGVGEFFAIPENHLSICKPANRQSFLYQKVLSMVKRYINIS